jgi:UDP-glucose:(heptosyl)LPS alpha-1,3-glucosyltransferase
MAIGLPVVVSGPKYCGISSHLQDGQQAMLLFDPGDAIELAKLLNAVLHQPVLAKQLIECARRFAQNHTWESAASQYDVLYQQVRTISQ